MVPYEDIVNFLGEYSSIVDFVPQVTGMSQLSSDESDVKCYMFGVPAEKYLKMMTSIKILEGQPWSDGEKGLMLSKDYASQLQVKIGDILQFEIQEGFSSRIRAVPLTAIYEYSVENSVMDKIVLVSPETVRAIMDMTDYSSSDQIKVSDSVKEMLDASDLDSLFSDTADMEESVLSEEVVVSEEELEAYHDSYKNSTSWNYMICRVDNPKETSKIIKDLNLYFAQHDWPVEAVNWRSSAGNTAFYLYILRLIFNIGILIILGAGFIVVNNTLVINVLDRIREIGTMRAIGANKRYIMKECASETLIMAFFAGLIGCILGIIAAFFLNSARVTFANEFLIQLFGGTVLHTSVNFINLLGSFSLSIFIGLIAWIYPLLTAIRINPVEAMQGAK